MRAFSTAAGPSVRSLLCYLMMRNSSVTTRVLSSITGVTPKSSLMPALQKNSFMCPAPGRRVGVAATFGAGVLVIDVTDRQYPDLRQFDDSSRLPGRIEDAESLARPRDRFAVVLDDLQQPGECRLVAGKHGCNAAVAFWSGKR
jgi:hypothetical protein